MSPHSARPSERGSGRGPERSARPRLDAVAVRRGMRLSIIEGMAFALMVGVGETFFLADAIRLSASRLQQGLVVSLPLFAGAVGSVTSLLLLARMRSRKPLVVASACLQALVLAALSIASALGRSTPELLIAATTLGAICGQTGGAAWSSWFGDLVPASSRGRYFGVRNRWIYLTTFCGVLVGGRLLAWFEPHGPIAGPLAAAANAGLDVGARVGGTGFAVIYGVAACARLVSSLLHLASPEPPFGGLAPRARAARFMVTAQGKGIARLVLGGAAFYATVYIASPYFAPYMLEELRFEYWQYTLASAAVIVAKVSFLPMWGRTVDQVGARPVYLVAALMTSIVPLPFLWADGLGWVLVAQGLSGIAWAGYELSNFTLVLERTYRRVRPQVFAMQSLANGLAQLSGSLCGALLVSSYSLSLVWLFAVSLTGRTVISLALPLVLRNAPWETPLRRREVLFRVAGFRVSGGLGLRPLPESAARPRRQRDAADGAGAEP
ncbi:MAG: MFS transporter [Planctomycetota bacterium]